MMSWIKTFMSVYETTSFFWREWGEPDVVAVVCRGGCEQKGGAVERRKRPTTTISHKRTIVMKGV